MRAASALASPRGHGAVARGAPTRMMSPESERGAEAHVRDILPAIVDASPTPIALFQPDRTLVYRNAAWAALFGDDGPDLLAEEPDPIALALDDGRASAAGERGVRGPGGASIRVLLTVTPIHDDHGDIVGAAAYGEPLDRAAASTLREAFIGVLSHELRTPITSIYGGSQLLLKEDLSADSRSQVLAAIAAEAEQLHRRVEDFLAIVRVERGAGLPEREPISLARLVRQAVAAEIRRSGERPYDIRIEPQLPPVSGDEAQVAQVLRNLIGNAATVSPSGAPVEIQALASGTSVETRIADRSVVAQRASDDAFSLSYRHGGGAGGHTPSSGLGLYVARALVEANGGRIGIRPRPGGGTEVAFTLPVYDVPAEA